MRTRTWLGMLALWLTASVAIVLPAGAQTTDAGKWDFSGSGVVSHTNLIAGVFWRF